MNVAEHAWIKLGEECSEVRQRIDKLMQFGPDEKEPGQELTNMERLQREYADIQASVYRLQSMGLFQPLRGTDLESHIRTKNAKVNKYLELSIALGMVSRT